MGVLLYVHSSFVIILMWKRELIALIGLSSWFLVIVVWHFLVMPWVCLQFVIVVFPDHTHVLFLLIIGFVISARILWFIFLLLCRYGKSAAQIMIRWSVQKGFITIPRSSKPERIIENSEVFDWSLSEDDMKLLVSIGLDT